MTPGDYKLIQALNKCRLKRTSWDGRFVESLAKKSSDDELTERQQWHLKRLAVKHRKRLVKAGVRIEVMAAK